MLDGKTLKSPKESRSKPPNITIKNANNEVIRILLPPFYSLFPFLSSLNQQSFLHKKALAKQTFCKRNHSNLSV
jgi:hypothetical protein